MTTPVERLANFCLLPELKLLEVRWGGLLLCEKNSDFEVCPRCATPSSSVYDHRWVVIKDEPIRQSVVRLRIRKRRFSCRPCQRPFTEPVNGILPRRRTTQRFRTALMAACEKYVDLKLVRREFQCSWDFLYRAYYEQLERKRRTNCVYPWPKSLGIDEHGFLRRRFVSVLVNHSRGKVMEVVPGKSLDDLYGRLSEIPGRENVREVSMDMSSTYRTFARTFFPQADIVADKFHVLRMLSPAILKHRRKITSTNSDRTARALLLASSKKLDYGERLAIRRYLEKHPELAELYDWKEALHGFYRIRGQRRAAWAMDQMLERMKASQLPEIRRLRNTLANWKQEILNYFKTRLTNARVEGFNNKASLVRKRGYGYRNPEHYRLRVLSVCG